MQRYGVSATQSNPKLCFFLLRWPSRDERSPGRHPSMPDDFSPLAPPLPIPNRTVKRRRADDSADCPCESRSSSGPLTKPTARSGGPLALAIVDDDDLLEGRQSAGVSRLIAAQANLRSKLRPQAG